MIKKATVSVLFCILLSVPLPCFAQSISSSELIKNARTYDGKAVVFQGEVIGEVMQRGSYAWVNVYDGENALGVWMPEGMSRDIQYAGGYKRKGDTIEVTGVFRRACLEHGGDLDIHAQAIRKISPGREIKEQLSHGKRNVVFTLAGVLCLVMILRLFRAK